MRRVRPCSRLIARSYYDLASNRRGQLVAFGTVVASAAPAVAAARSGVRPRSSFAASSPAATLLGASLRDQKVVFVTSRRGREGNFSSSTLLATHSASCG